MRDPSLAQVSASSIAGSICCDTAAGVAMRVRLPGASHSGIFAPDAGSTNSTSNATA